jgi:hypothetical protein
MKTFKKFPKDNECPLCGTNKDSLYKLVPIEGTGDGKNFQALPVHIKCIKAQNFMLQPMLGIMYSVLPSEEVPASEQELTIIPQPERKEIE